jgi:sec-independent protein translocase protein TatC
MAIALNKAERLVGRKPGVVNTTLMDGMNVWFKVCMVTGFVIGSPWIFYQIWLFISAGLYPQEKKLVHYYLPFSIALFLGGVFLCEIFVIPAAIRILLEFNEWVGGEPQLHMADWLNFALMMPVIFGLAFQTPLVMLGMAKIGIFDANTFRRKRRIAWFVLAVLAAVITPTPDLVTMSLMWVPMCFLYELGIILAARAGKQASEDIPEPEEMVGV